MRIGIQKCVHHFIVVMALFGFGLVSGCIVQVDSNDRIEGRGPTETRDFSVSNFNEISMAIPGDLVVVQGEEEFLSISAQSNLFRYIETFVEGDRLVIETERNTSIDPSRTISVRIGVRSLDVLSFAGSGEVNIDALVTTNFHLSMAGQGEIDIRNLSAETLEVSFAGSGEMMFTGEVNHQEIDLAGSGDIEARDLTSSTAEIEIAGSGSAFVSVADELKATILGSGSVLYLGNPRVDSQILGSGSVSALGRQ